MAPRLIAIGEERFFLRVTAPSQLDLRRGDAASPVDLAIATLFQEPPNFVRAEIGDAEEAMSSVLRTYSVICLSAACASPSPDLTKLRAPPSPYPSSPSPSPTTASPSVSSFGYRFLHLDRRNGKVVDYAMGPWS